MWGRRVWTFFPLEGKACESPGGEIRQAVFLCRSTASSILPFSDWAQRETENWYHPPARMNNIVLSLLLGLTAAAANIFGGAIIVQKSWERSYLKYFVALGAGFMLATSIVEIFPASLELRGEEAAFLVLAGYLIIHFFEHTVTPHFHFGEETHEDLFVEAHKGYSVLLGLTMHTFFDGIAITSGFLVSNWLGWIIFVAIFLHKIPEGFTITSVMLASGRSRRVAWGASAILGAATFIGVAVMAVWRREVSFALPLSAGVTIYVAASDLMPEVNREPGVATALVVFLGAGLLMVFDRFFHMH
jgi:zinc and cadmium transporter